MAQGKSAREFAADLRRFAKAIDVSAQTALKKILFEAFTRIVMRSPVDTGRFRASWTMAEGAPDVAIKAEGNYPPPPTPDLALRSPWTIVWINNSLPYAVPLELGHSRQAPRGMVTLTVVELERYINTIARAV